MPKSTFYNLPKDKKNKILEVAIDEFVKYSYHKGSITRIVNEAGIAKGSFYQYFQGKKDLFKYIINTAKELEEKYIEKELENLSDDAFRKIKNVYLGQIKFQSENPKLASIKNSFIKSGDDKFIEDILGESDYNKDEIFRKVLSIGIEKGDISPGIDIENCIFVLNSISLSTEELLKERVDIENALEGVLSIIKGGIKGKKSLRLSNRIEDRFY